MGDSAASAASVESQGAPASKSATSNQGDQYDYTQFIAPRSQSGTVSSDPEVEQRVEQVKMFPPTEETKVFSDKHLQYKQLKELPTEEPAVAAAPSTDQVDETVYGKTPDFKAGSEVEKAESTTEKAQKLDVSSSKDPRPDLVLVFALPTPEAPASEWKEATEEYDQLKRLLAKSGFKTAALPGSKGSNERLLLVKAVTSLITAEAQAEKLSDWLQSVKGVASREEPHTLRDFRAEPVRSAERTRLVYKVFEKATYSEKTSKPFPRLKAAFPPQNVKFNTSWLRNWSSWKLQVSEEELSEVRDHFGDSVALYFEFLRYYFISLAIPSFIGLTTWMAGAHFSSLYSILLVIWSVIFVEGWKLREKQLSVRWGTYGVTSTHGKVRLGFKAEETITSPITGDEIPYSPWWKRELRIAASVPAALGFAVLLAGVISVIFSTEVIINEVYNGPAKSFFALIPTILFAGLVPQVVGLWYTTAKQLTFWENYPTEVEHERSLTLKMFALNAIVSYGALTLTAYIYLPFGNWIVPRLVGLFLGSVSEKRVSRDSLSSSAEFAATSERLTNTLFALMTTTQAIGAFTEVALPYIQKKIAEKKTQAEANKATSGKKASGLAKLSVAEENKGWLDRIKEEVALPEYSLFTDYAEMAVQFGHVVLFSTAWPLAPVAAFINNFFELRGDAFKLCINSRRPIPVRTDSIGPWIEVLSLITYLGALSNASLVYLLKPVIVERSTSKTLLKQVGHAISGNLTAANATESSFITNRIQESSHDLPSVRSTLLGALLAALASEHAFVLLRTLVQHLMRKLVWEGSDEEVHLRHTDFRLKRNYVESLGVSNFEEEVNRLYSRRSEDVEKDDSDPFWNTEDKGLREEVEKKAQ